MTTPALSNHLATGYDDGRPGETASLSEAGREWTSAADTGYRPISVLEQYRMSPGNGRSAQDADRVLPDGTTVLPTNNGTSENTSAAQLPLRMAGDLPI